MLLICRSNIAFTRFHFHCRQQGYNYIKRKKLLANIPLTEPILCATSITGVSGQFFKMHTLTPAERKTFQCINDTKRHLPYCNPDLKAVKTVQLLYINRANIDQQS